MLNLQIRLKFPFSVADIHVPPGTIPIDSLGAYTNVSMTTDTLRSFQPSEDFTTIDSEELVVEPTATVGLGLNSAAAHDISDDSLFTASELSPSKPWLVEPCAPAFLQDMEFTGAWLENSAIFVRAGSLESAAPFAVSVNGLITVAIINGKIENGKYSQFRDYAHLGVGLTVGSAILLWDSSVRGLSRKISQYLDVTTPFTVGRVARFVTLPMRCPKPSCINPSCCLKRRWNPEGSCETETPLTCLLMTTCPRLSSFRPIFLVQRGRRELLLTARCGMWSVVMLVPVKEA